MKRILLIALVLFCNIALAQTFTVNNLAVNGTSAHAGAATFSIRPTFNGNTPWDSGNFNPSNYATLSGNNAFTGTNTAPLAALGTNNSQLATTAFVAQHAPCQDIMDYGGNDTGSADNTSAFASASTAGLSGLACVYFPPGVFAFNSQTVYTFPVANGSISILGAGQDVTRLAWNGGQGMQINFLGASNSAHIRDMSFTTAQFNTGSGLFFNQAAASIPNPANTAGSDITNVTFVGASGYGLGNYYWQFAFQDFGVSNINFTNDMFFGGSTTAGQGAYIYGTSSLPPVVFNFNGCTFNYWSTGINYGNYVQGMTLNYTNMGGVGNGIFSASGLSNTQSELNIVNSQFGAVTTAAVNLGTAIAPMSISNSLFEINPGTPGIFFNPGALFTITGNIFLGLTSNTSNTGIDVVSMTSFNNENAGVITGNLFFGLNHPIYLDTGSSNINVQSNAYQNIAGTHVTNLGTGNTVGGGSQ